MELINTKERRVLGALSKLGEASISIVARETMINRTALYHTVEKLMAKGLVSKVTRDNATYFQAMSSSEFDEWAKRKQQEVAESARNLKAWMDAQRGEKSSLHTDIRYFEGQEGVKNLYADTWRDNKEKIIYAITDYEQAYKTLGTFFRNEYFPDRIAQGVHVKNLLPKSAHGKRDVKTTKAFLRDMRFIDLFKHLGIEINIYGPKVAIVSFDEKKPSGLVIKNAVMADAFKNIFDYLWKHSGK